MTEAEIEELRKHIVWLGAEFNPSPTWGGTVLRLIATVDELRKLLRVVRGSAELRPDGTTVREIDEVLQKTQQLTKPERVTCERCGSRYAPEQRHGCVGTHE